MPLAGSQAQRLEEERVLEHRVVPELVIRRVLVRVIVIQFIAEAIDWEAGGEPAEENIIGYVLLRGLVLEVGLVWQLEISVGRLARNMITRSSWSSKGSALLSCKNLENKVE